MSACRYEPLGWMLVFVSATTIPWLDRLIIGRFKHVIAFGWVDETQTWICYDIQIGRTRILSLPDEIGSELIAAKLAGDPGAAALRIEASDLPPSVVRLGFWCVPAMKRLVGLRSGALRPDRLWRDCIASGAEVIHDARSRPISGSNRSDARGEGCEEGC